MKINPDQAKKKFNHSCMACRACVKLPLYAYGIDAIIDTQMLKNTHNMLVHLAALDYGRNPVIGTLKKERRDAGYIFSECCTKISKNIFYGM